MIKKKPLIILADTNSEFSIKICSFLSKQKYFKIEFIIFSKNSNNTDIRKILNFFSYKINFIKSKKPHLHKKIDNIIENKKINLCISTSFPYLLSETFLNLFKMGVINFHPSALPLNRGSHHSFWGILKDACHGCTMHYMNKKLDSGDIIDQIKYKNKSDITAKEIYNRSHSLMLTLLKKNILKIYHNKIKVIKNDKKGSFHKKNEIEEVINLNVKDKIKVDYLWKIIRGTYIGKNGFFINDKRRKYKIVSKIFEVKKNLKQK